MTNAAIESITRSGWLDDFELCEEIGRGGMGVVYRARWARNGQIVALKILPLLATADGAALERFQREAEAAGRIDHPGVVPVFAVGEHGGVNYFAMELVEGPSLHALIDSLRPGSAARLVGSIAEETALDAVYPQLRKVCTGSSVMHGYRYACSCAEIAVQVADALVAAHAGGVIHRDIKPSNILLSSSGRPVLVDFGLARDETMLGLTVSGEALGTPAYMAPEQACGERDLDTRVDIYGLGATLYELLSLRPPFEGRHTAEIMRQIVEENPSPLRRLNPRVPARLEAIVHTCLAKDPDRRYASMQALVDDLRLFLAGKRVHARILHPGRRLHMFLRRHRSVTMVGSAIFAACFSIFILVGIISIRMRQDQGLAALAQARQLEGDRAQEAYGRAVALLGPERVRTARRTYLREVFPVLYAKGQFAELRKHLEAWPPADRDEEWADQWVQLEGRGKLMIEGLALDAGDLAFVRGVTADGSLQSWQPFVDGRELALGDYLLRLERVGEAVALHRVHIDRDRETVLRGFSRPASVVDEDFALIVGGPDSKPVSVQRTEISAGAYAEFLVSLQDTALQTELLPKGWDKPIAQDGRELPVRGISYRQARIAAALLGGHLMSDDEYDLASTGGLAEMPYPWGYEFDPTKVTADPDRLTRPMPVDSLAQGASPAGILNLVGNMAEILAPGPGGAGQLAGGHYLSRSGELRVDSRLPLGDPGVQHDLAGFRLARFLPPAEDETILTLVESKIVEMTSRQHRGAFADWTLSAIGELTLRETLTSAEGEDLERFALDVASEGYVATEVTRRSAAEGASAGSVFVTKMLGRSGLYGRNGRFFMTLPLRGGIAGDGLTRLRLPGPVRIDMVDPKPAMVYTRGDDQVLVWEQFGRSAGAPISARIRFRRDGLLAAWQPTLDGLRPIVESFIAALNHAASDRLAIMLDPEFRQSPQGANYSDLVKRGASRLTPRETFTNLRIVDADAVGDVASVWLRADWQVESRDGRLLSFPDWNLRVQLRRAGDGYRVLSLAPHGRSGGGALGDEGYLGPERLKVRFGPPVGMSLRRGHDGPSEAQVECSLDDQQAASFALYGEYTVPGHDPEMIMHRLTQGALSARPGRRLPGPKVAFLGSADEGSLRQVRRIQDWLFGRPDGDDWSRERWMFVQLGRRWFWIRERASGSNPDEAKQRFRAASAAFLTLEQSLHIR